MKTLTTILFLLLSHLVSSQVALNTERFSLERTDNELYLTDKELGDKVDILDMDNWSDRDYASEFFFYEFNDSNYGWSEKVTAFNIEDNIFVHLQAYNGEDRIFYILNYNNKLFNFSYISGRDHVEYGRTTVEAYGKYHLLADINADGHADLGVVEERIYTKNDSVYFSTIPITWHLWDKYWWSSDIYQGNLDNINYIELSPSTIVEEIGLEYWLTYNPLEWRTEKPDAEIFIPSSRLELARQEAKMARDKKTLKALRAYQNPMDKLTRKKAVTKPYASNELINKATQVIKDEFPEAISQYFKLEMANYEYLKYDYLSRLANPYTGSLEDSDSTKGIFSEAKFRFRFEHPEYEWAHNLIDFTLDSDFNLVYEPDYNIVPAFLIDANQPKFITKEKIIELGKAALYTEEEEWVEAKLEYDYEHKRYLWDVLKKIKMSSGCYINGYCKLDATTGDEVYKNVSMWKKDECK